MPGTGILVDISEIDPKLRPASDMRVGLNQEAISDYAESIDEMPPVELAYDPDARIHWVIDGAHRISGAKLRGRPRIRATVTTMGRLDAFRAASRANLANPVRITNADKRHRVEVALADPEMSRWSNRRIAEWCAVHPSSVDRVRPQLPQNGSCDPPRTVGRDGKARKAPAPRRPSPRPAGQSLPDVAREIIRAVPPIPAADDPLPGEVVKAGLEAMFAAMSPSGPEEIPPVNATPDDPDADYLSRFAIRDSVCSRRFDDDALIYRLIAPHLEAIRDALPGVIGDRSVHAMGRLHRMVRDILNVPGPERWSICDQCGGLGRSRGPCRTCKQCGYVIPNSLT